jgi:predicted pyridoxine 5'-phosphate oxidase superfamily flavin-nucleotide-binding protein
MKDFLYLAQTNANFELQEQRGSRGLYGTEADGAEHLSEHEIQHITSRNSFYMATVNEDGWPYVQHRGGEDGFVKILGPTRIGWVERTGNRQYLGTGNITANGRVSMILVDYAQRTRLKLLGTATYHNDPDAALTAVLNPHGHRIDGAITMDVVATTWNCPKYITPRLEVEQVRGAFDELQQRVAELEAENARLVAR